MSLELVVEIALDTGTERHSLIGLASKTKMYSEKVVSFSDIDRDVSLVPGEFRLSDITVELDNSKNYWSDLRSRTPFKNRVITMLLGDTDLGEADFTTVAKGKITNTGGANVFSIEATDPTLSRFEQKITPVITKALFQDLPDSTPLNLVPQVIGEVSSSGLSNTGAVPAYLVDPALSQAKYRYVAMLGAAKSIDTVYLYGAVVGSGFTTSQQTIGGTEFTVIDFDADQRDANRPNELEVTWGGKGLTDDGLSSGTLLTNPSDIWKEVLTQNGFVSGDLDTASFAAAKLILDSRGILGGFAVVDKDEDIRGLAEKMAESFNMNTFMSKAGLVFVTAQAPASLVTDSLVEIDESQIAVDTFDNGSPEELASTMAYQFSKNWQADEFDEQLSITDSKQTVAIGEDLTKTVELHYIRHASSAAAVVHDKLFFMREERATCGFMADPTLFKQINIGDDIRLTHFAGLGLSGYSKQLFRTTGIGLAFDGENLLTRFSGVDLTPQDLSVTKGYQQFQMQRPLIWSDAATWPNRSQPSGPRRRRVN